VRLGEVGGMQMYSWRKGGKMLGRGGEMTYK
jgi:hypothetical protein